MEFQCRYWTTLDVKRFGKILSKTQLSHKYYFFPVIVEAISEGKKEISFDEIAERMIAEAWYPVVEHHIHLGAYTDKEPNDWIEKSICYIQNIIHAKAEINPDELIKKIKELEVRGDRNIVECKEMIIRYAPYRLLSPFLNAKESDFQIEERIFKKIEEANAQDSLPYTIDRTSKKLLERKIVFDLEWSKFIKDNSKEILGWINNERLIYLQKGIHKCQV